MPKGPTGEKRPADVIGAASRATHARRSCYTRRRSSTRCWSRRSALARPAIAEMVDMFVLVLPPAAGGELQRIKHGVVELGGRPTRRRAPLCRRLRKRSSAEPAAAT